MPSLRHAPRALRVAVVSILGALVTLVVAVLLLMIAQAGRILPGTTVAGVSVGGLDVWSARRVLGPTLAGEELRVVSVGAPGERLQVRVADAGLSIDVDASVQAAFARGRTGRPGAVFARLTAPLWSVEIAPRATIDEALLAGWIDQAARSVEREATVGDLRIDATTGSVTLVGPRGAVHVDRDASIELLRTALLAGNGARTQLAVTTTPPPSTYAALEGLSASIRWALADPLVLEHDGNRLVVTPEMLGGLLTVAAEQTEGSLRPALRISPERVATMLGVAGREAFASTASDARIITEREPPVQLSELSTVTFVPEPVEVAVIPGTSDVTFIPRLTSEQLVTMVLSRTRIATADLLVVEPELTTEAVLAGRPTHLIGTFTTFHPAGTPRTGNIRLLADLLDDRIVAPGEEFSINTASGPRRCEDGFVPAGTIIRGELVDTCGGGVSQFGTTLMNAAFFAGVTLEEWQPHSFFISRYPAGREATLSYPELDVRFTNDTDGFIVVRTSHTPTSITVALYGVPRWSSVQAVHSERRAPTTATELVRIAPDLSPGTRRLVQAGGGGFTITVSRIRAPLPGDAALPIERWTTVYRPQQRIVEVGAS